jgi:hypothetical protein
MAVRYELAFQGVGSPFQCRTKSQHLMPGVFISNCYQSIATGMPRSTEGNRSAARCYTNPLSNQNELDYPDVVT